jgi:L-seryl-tRNA(Ser) seleniumtransferase
VARKSESEGGKAAQVAYRLLPAVEQALAAPEVARLGARVPRELLTAFVRRVVEAWRDEVRAGQLDALALQARLTGGALTRAVEALVAAEERRGVVRAINATGVVLHTGLGRAPVHPEAAAAMAAAAGGYCVVEVDRESGERNQRDEHLSALLARLSGAEAGIVVNNNAGALLLALQTFAGGGREVVVSRGELVEIGGSFRIPAIMECAGVRLVEVGTTNRTRMEDYRRAIGPATALLLKVHTSNFRVEGFTQEVSADELAVLGSEHGLPTCFDLGSGLVECAGAAPLAMLQGEPRVRDAVSSGVDVVTFSGDKLLGGPQAGLLVGTMKRVGELRACPLYRALRMDKVGLAGLEATLRLYLAGRADELPARALLLRGQDELRAAAERIARAIGERAGLRATVVPERSQPGSGSAPGVELETFAVRVTSTGRSARALAQALRRAEPPVFARIQDDALLLDPRTLLEGDEERLLAAFAGLP